MDHSFTQFANQITNDPILQQTLSYLQQQHALNGNIILFAIWWGQCQHGRLNKHDYKILLSTIHAWHERVIIALQRLLLTSTAVKNKQLELQKPISEELTWAENIERQFIEETLLKFHSHQRNPNQQLNDACHNITHYCNLLQIPITSEDMKAIIQLLQASFPDLISNELAENCETIFKTNLATTHHPFSQLTLTEM